MRFGLDAARWRHKPGRRDLDQDLIHQTHTLERLKRLPSSLEPKLRLFFWVSVGGASAWTMSR